MFVISGSEPSQPLDMVIQLTKLQEVVENVLLRNLPRGPGMEIFFVGGPVLVGGQALSNTWSFA